MKRLDLQNLITRLHQATPEQLAWIDRSLTEQSVNSGLPGIKSLTAGAQTTVIEPLIKQPVLAERMHVCPRTISNLIETGLPHYKIGRSLLFRWSEIEAYLIANCRVPRLDN